jgi:DNA replication and repair protein RecF
VIYITEILLKDFRNYKSYQNIFGENHILFFGQNGVGKTNLLEALSKLSPGSGIKSAKNQDIARDQKYPWELNVKLSSSNSENDELNTIGISFNFKKKLIKVNSEFIKNSHELIEYIKLVWFTPQMNNLFIDDKIGRQKFFDRIVINFEKNHLRNLIIYEKLKKERKKLLFINYQEKWMGIIEDKLAVYCYEITQTRIQGIKFLQEKINSGNFIKPELHIGCEVNKYISGDKIDSINKIKEVFLSRRDIDKKLNKTTFGIHLTDFYAVHPKNHIKSNLCSTGEQKSIILSILAACSKSCDIILLDDISSHMDDTNFHLFLKDILNQNCQVFFADLNTEKFLPYKDQIKFIEIKNYN